MNKTTLRSIQMALLIAGAAGAIWLSTSFHRDGRLSHRPNLLHLKGSPFGRTLSLAMRGPVDVYWHRGGIHDYGHDHGEGCQDCEHGHEHGELCQHGHEHGELCEHEEECQHGEECDHGHEHGGEREVAHQHDEDCEHGHHHHHEAHHHDHDAPLATAFDGISQEAAGAAGPEPQRSRARGISAVRPFLLDRIEAMRIAYYSRTNTRADSRLHKAYIMGETQRRLETSYHMDPTNLAGYGAYFLFLSEALARVEGEVHGHEAVHGNRKAALELANYTIKYCLNYQDEAPAMITAATAAHDVLQIYLNQPEPDLKVAEEYLRLLDGCLHRFETIRQEMISNGLWQKFPVNRRSEMDDAHSLVRALREVDHKLFGQLSKNSTESTNPPSS